MSGAGSYRAQHRFHFLPLPRGHGAGLTQRRDAGAEVRADRRLLLDPHVVRRVHVHQVDRRSREQPRDVGLARAVAAQQPMAPKQPQVAGHGGGAIGQRRNLVFAHLERAQRDDVVEHALQLGLVVADAVQLALELQALQQPAERRQIPLGQLGRAVQRDAQRRRLRLAEVQLDHVGVRPAQRAHGHQPPVPAHDAPGALLHDQRLGLAEARETRADRVEVALAVLAGVGRIEMQGVERHAADRQAVQVEGSRRARGRRSGRPWNAGPWIRARRLGRCVAPALGADGRGPR